MSPQVVKDNESKFDFNDIVKDIVNLEEAEKAVRASNELSLKRNYKAIVDNFNNLNKSSNSKQENEAKKILEFCQAAKTKMNCHKRNSLLSRFFDIRYLNTEIKNLMRFLTYFWHNVNYIESLSVEERIVKLEAPGEILEVLCNAVKFDGIFNKNFYNTIFHVYESDGSYERNEFIQHLTSVYILIMFFIIEQFAFLAEQYFKKQILTKYRKYLQSAALFFKQLKTQLVGGEESLIDLLQARYCYVQCNTLLHWRTTMSEMIYPVFDEAQIYEAETTEQRLTTLHIAAFQADLEVIKATLKQNCCQLNTPDLAGFTPLHCAIFGGAAVLEHFLAHEHININAQSQAGLTALHIATINNCLEAVQTLLKNPQIDVNLASVDGWTALHIAVSMRHKEIVAELLKVETLDVDAKMFSQITSLHIAAKLDDEEILNMLLQTGAKIKKTTKNAMTAQQIAEKFNCFNISKLLEVEIAEKIPDNTQNVNFPNEFSTIIMESNANIESPTTNDNFEINAEQQEDNVDIAARLLAQLSLEDDDASNQLFHAVLKGELETIKSLNANGADLTKPHKSGKSALNFAIMINNLEIFKFLLGAQNLGTHACESLLFEAAESGAFDIVRYFIEEKSLNPQIENGKKRTLLCAAIESGNFDMVKYLLVDQCVPYTSTPANCPLCTAVEVDSLIMVKYFLDKGLDIQGSCDEQRPLISAAKKGSFKMFLFLLEKGALIDVSSNGKGVLDYAAIAGNSEILNYLIKEKGYTLASKIPNCGLSIFFQFCRAGKLQDIKYFVEVQKCDVHERGPFGGTILHEAAFNRHLEVVRYFVEQHGFDEKARDDRSLMPLFYAVQENNLDVVKYFVGERKLGVHVKDKHNRTILHYAVLGGDIDVVRYLVEVEKANFNVKDNEGLTPLPRSAENKDTQNILEYFLKQQFADYVENASKATILHYAARLGDVGLIKTLVEKRNMNANETDALGQTPIFYAALAGQIEAVEYFRKSGKVKFNTKDSEGQTVQSAVNRKFLESAQVELKECLKWWESLVNMFGE